MPRQTRHRTEYSGVYFVELANQVQSFFIRYKRNGRSVEEKAGRSNHGWNAKKAYKMRTERKSGICATSGEIRSKVLNKDQQHWTFSKIFAEYLRIRKELKGRENDVYRFKNYLEMEFSDKTPENVTLGDVERIMQNLQNKRLKPATVRNVLELLRRLANFAVKKKLCPGLNFKIEMPSVENHKTESLTQDQLQKLMDVLDEELDVQVSNLVRLALFTGMRRGELFSLSWSDIDFHNKTITIRSGNNGQHSTIPLNKLAENVLIEQAQAEGGSKFVFPGRGGKKRTECKRPLLRIKLKAGLPADFRILQGLRHVYASILASSGNVELETLQALLTQKSSLMTQRYAHLLDEAQKISSSTVGERTNSVFDSAEKEETLCGRVKDDYSENDQHPAFPEENVSELLEEDTLQEEKVEDYNAEYARTVIRLKEQPLGEEQKEDFVEDYEDTEVEPEARFLEEEQENDYFVKCTDTDIAPKEEHKEDFVEGYMSIEIATEEETTHFEDDLSTHIAQIVEEDVCRKNENELTVSAEKSQKNKDLDLHVDSVPLQEETLCSDNRFAEFFETNKNLNYSDKNESTKPVESTEAATKVIEVEESLEVEVPFKVSESEDAEKVVEVAAGLSENISKGLNVEECVEDNNLEDVSLCRIEGGEEGTVHSENVTVGTVEEALEIEEILETESVLGAERENLVKSNYLPPQHYEIREENSPKENVVSEHDEDAQNQEIICKKHKLETETEKKGSFMNQIHKYNHSGVNLKEVQVNEVLKAKNLTDENKVPQKERPSLAELKNDLKSLSQLIHSAPRRRVKTSAVKNT